MKILYISNKPPAPIVDGGSFAMFDFLKQCSQIAKVDALILSTKKQPYTEKSSAILQSVSQSITSISMQPDNFIRAFIKSVVTRKSFLMCRFSSNKLSNIIKNKLSDHYDFIVCDHLFAAASFYVSTIKTTVPLFIRAHNIETIIWNQRSELSVNPIKKALFSRFSKQLLKAETTLFKQAQQVLTISKTDENWINHQLPTVKTITLPVSIPVTKDSTNYQEIGFFHIGSMNWQPNVDAVNYLINTLWKIPSISSFPLKIAGYLTENLSKKLDSKSIVVAGWVNNSAEFMQHSGVLIAPVFSGSGIRIKLLEAMALGIPCLTTSLGASGISIEESGVLIADDAEAFEKLIHQLAESESFRKQVGSKSRMYISEYHNPEKCLLILKQSFGIQ